jgi:hypothetical protein
MTFDIEANKLEAPLRFRDGGKLHTAQNNLNLTQACVITGIPVRLLEIFRQETNWDLDPDVETVRELNHTERKPVGLGEMKCPLCQNTNYIDVHQIGRDTGLRISTVRRCICSALKLYYSRWCNPRNIPAMYQDAEYHAFFAKGEFGDKLRSRIFHGAFKDETTLILNTIDQFRDAGFLLTGKGGCGKSTLACAMYQRDLQAWALSIYDKDYVESVWKISAKTLAEEFQAWALRFNTEERERRRNQIDGDTTKEPTVTVDKINRAVAAGLVPCLYLEEIDKFKNSDFQLTQFHAILDAIQTNGGRVIATSNLQIEDLSHRLDEQYAEACIRRICGAPKGVHIEFTSNRAFIKINYPDNEAATPFYPFRGRAGNVEGKKLLLIVERAKDLKHKVVATVETKLRTGTNNETEVLEGPSLPDHSNVQEAPQAAAPKPLSKLQTQGRNLHQQDQTKPWETRPFRGSSRIGK